MFARRVKRSAPGGETVPADKWVPALLVILALGYVGLCWTAPIGPHVWSPLGETMLHGDSESFFFESPSSRYRWAGYPLFLELVEAVFGTANAAPRVQLVLLAASVCFLGFAVWQALRAPWLAFALAAAVFGVSAVSRLHAYLLSDGLFVPLVCALAGVVALLVGRPTVSLAAAGAVLCGLAIAVRPAGIAMLALWPALAWLLWPRYVGRCGRLAAAVALPLVVVFGAEAVVWKSIHGWASERHSIVDRALFAKAVLVREAPASAAIGDAELAEFLADARRRAAPLRDLVAAAPERRMGAIMLRNAEGHVEGVSYGLLREPIAELAERRGAADPLLGQIGWGTMLSLPGAWFANAATHWLSLWTYYSVNDAAFARRYQVFVRSKTDIGNAALFEAANMVRPKAAAPKPLVVVWVVRLTAAAALAGTVFAFGAVIWRRIGRGLEAVDDGLVAAATAALLAHGPVLVVALFNKALLRYIAVTWPLQALCMLLLAHWAWRRWRAWERGRPARIGVPQH